MALKQYIICPKMISYQEIMDDQCSNKISKHVNEDDEMPNFEYS